VCLANDMRITRRERKEWSGACTCRPVRRGLHLVFMLPKPLFSKLSHLFSSLARKIPDLLFAPPSKRRRRFYGKQVELLFVASDEQFKYIGSLFRVTIALQKMFKFLYG
jgi:hypothetical protein